MGDCSEEEEESRRKCFSIVTSASAIRSWPIPVKSEEFLWKTHLRLDSFSFLQEENKRRRE